ncbi:tumor necrosis factor-like [Pocillopora damicornis]|uniref:tumor necrosis factor-like n=1 Tax=Pocillopora damicornis TaxID=46731 RepID=UPI000F5505F1|nr:tumor necrosis factor-like [Pocillopora damicornis]
MTLLEVKILLSCVFLIYTNVEAARSPKPLAHIEATEKKLTDYRVGQAIKDWDAGNVHSHLEGGMKYSNGRLIVPQDGEYYVYAQLYFRSSGRVLILKNHHEVITILQHSHNVPEGPHYAGGVFYFKAYDTIELQTARPVSLYMSSFHSYFGAFLIQ